jgi:hypothetical protein
MYFTSSCRHQHSTLGAEAVRLRKLSISAIDVLLFHISEDFLEAEWTCLSCDETCAEEPFRLEVCDTHAYLAVESGASMNCQQTTEHINPNQPKRTQL